jgi:hypothetical protein
MLKKRMADTKQMSKMSEKSREKTDVALTPKRILQPIFGETLRVGEQGPML